ncbi:hypothetical protein ABWL39_07130 [Chitinivorax sp. PXF-14]|uniref:hypothetical protein n=1 Tax=Chitinivorax sp. PXF-14 TaxID=3230488 RepID=UPI00346584AC
MIIFLDFDGVLRPDAVYLEWGRPVLRAEGELFMWTGYLVEALAGHPGVRTSITTRYRTTCAGWLVSVARCAAHGGTP